MTGSNHARFVCDLLNETSTLFLPLSWEHAKGACVEAGVWNGFGRRAGRSFFADDLVLSRAKHMITIS